jgi:hypothetical protein
VPRFFLALVTAALLLTATGCTVDDGTSASGNEPVQKNAMTKGANLSLRVNKGAFSPNQDVEVNIDITNTSSQPIAYYAANSCDDGVNVYVKAQDGKQQLVQMQPTQKGSGRMCAEVVRHLQLQPGAKVAKSVAFKVQPAAKTQPLQAGTYLVHAELRMDPGTQPIAVEAPIKIVGD